MMRATSKAISAKVRIPCDSVHFLFPHLLLDQAAQSQRLGLTGVDSNRPLSFLAAQLLLSRLRVCDGEIEVQRE